MSDDKKISQLISLSLRHELSQQESAEVEKHLSDNDDSRKFAELSSLIQKSVATNLDPDQTASDKDNGGLSEESKQRLKRSVTEAVQEKLSLSKAGLLGDTGAPTKSQSKTDAAGFGAVPEKREVMSRFNLIRRLGQGGLGNVWLARDEKLNRTVAIKELNAEALESPKAWERFHREAEITGHLEHPNIVPLYQFGVDRKTGEPFYAMRFVGKRTLANAIEEHHDRVEVGEAGALGLHRLLSVFLDVCQAIAYAHSHGVVHRDLKPDNIALDSFGQVIVLDWGLAKVLEDCELASKMTGKSNIDDSNFGRTLRGDVVGTPLYMSPEQAAGELEKIDDKTDVYGLGAILFSILTGNAPHENSASGSAIDMNSFLKKIASAETPRAIDYGKSISGELESICAKAMARKRHLRYDSVQQLADEVERWIAGQSRKHAAYETLRMEGRELRADMQSKVSDLERNVRFAASLPPIEQLVNAESEADEAEWRERLSSIFKGLLKANPNYRGIVYCKVADSQFTELVRVERHSQDTTTIRAVPRSRLKSSAVNEYIEAVTKKMPEEVHTSLVCNPMCEMSEGCNETVGLIAGVPVYDNQTEDVFGFVVINCDIDQMLRQQMNRRISADEIVVACDIFHIMMHVKSGQISEETLTKTISDTAPYFVPAVDFLQTNTEFIDETNADIYGARLWFVPGKHGIMYLLKR